MQPDKSHVALVIPSSEGTVTVIVPVGALEGIVN